MRNKYDDMYHYGYGNLKNEDLIKKVRKADTDLYCDRLNFNQLNALCTEIANRYEKLLKERGK